MYAHAMDHDDVTELTDKDNYIEANISKREAADDGIYAGLYYQPNNFFGFEGKGQHYLQYSTGLLAGEGIGKIDTDFNKKAADDAVTYQLGLGGTVRLGDRTHMLVSYRSLRAENINARKFESYAWSYPDGNEIIYGRTEEASWRVDKLESDALVLRPIYSVNQNLDLWLEAGIGRRDTESYSGKNTEEHLYYKVSAGPQIKYYVGSAETSLRLFVTYIGDKAEKVDVRQNIFTKSSTRDLIGGFQVSAWW